MDTQELKKKFTQIDPRGVVAGVLLVSLIWAVGYYLFMLNEVKQTTMLKQNTQEVLAEYQTQLREAKKDDWYKRYQSAKKIFIASEDLDWTERTDYLIDLLNEIILIDQQDPRSSFENFQVAPTSIWLQGTVVSLTNMYREWGVIDSIAAFDFVENIEIPFYKSGEWWVEFLLNAAIKNYAK